MDILRSRLLIQFDAECASLSDLGFSFAGAAMLADYLLDDSKSQSRDAFAAALTLGVVSVPYVFKLVGSYTAAVVGYRDDSLGAVVTERNADPFVLACVADSVVEQVVYSSFKA